MKPKKKKEPLTADYLKKLKVPKTLVIGLLIASTLGWTGYDKLKDIKSYYDIREIFPVKTKAVQVIDGDTLVMENGLTLRLLGIDAPGRGANGYQEATDYLKILVSEQKLSLEYESYQDDKYGRILAYVFIPCRADIIEYCRNKKTLVNEVLVKKGYAKPVVFAERKKLKYEAWLSGK